MTCKTQGEEALRTALGEPCDLLITDLRMPAMDGLTLPESLREQSLDVPVISTTASGGDQTGVRALKAGAVGCLYKPLRLKDLMAAIRSLEAGAPPGTTGSG